MMGTPTIIIEFEKGNTLGGHETNESKVSNLMPFFFSPNCLKRWLRNCSF
jgi:hypothetical protein